MGFRLAIDQQIDHAGMLLRRLAGKLGDELVGALINAKQETDAEIAQQRARVADLLARLARLDDPDARSLAASADYLIRKSVWSFGGDGWAYDIGFGGLDHVFASGRDVNILVLDTEVYSNTGGQSSKATFRGAVAKFAAAGKPSRKKDLGMIAMAYGDVFVGQISLGANPLHAIKTIRAAESYRGTSLLIAFSHCIPTWGIDVACGMTLQKEAVACGYWPLYHFDPRDQAHPFHLGQPQAGGYVQGFRPEGGPLQDAGQLQARGLGPAAGIGAAGHRRALAPLRAIGRRRSLDGGRRKRQQQQAANEGGESMTADLTTKYLGLTLKNPLVIAACPLTYRVETLVRLEAAGAAAVVLPSLFEEQIAHDEVEMTRVHEIGTESFAESLTYFPEADDYHTGPETYLEFIEKAKFAVKIPVIASLNGISTGGWTRYAKMMQDAGADALELNVYFVAADCDTTAAQVESRYLELVAAVKKSVSIPLAVKVGPYFSAMANMARRLVEAGADGLVLFNRFLQPDIDLDTLETTPKLVLSSPNELLVPLRWIAILRGRVDASLALTSGLHDADGMAKALLAGADVGMVASTIYEDGSQQVGRILAGLRDWMEEKEYDSVEQLKGSMSQENCPDPAAFERGNYMKALTSYTGKAI